MNLEKYLKIVQSANRKKGIKISDKVLQAYKDRKYFNKQLLNDIPEEKIIENITIITNDVQKVVNARISSEIKTSKSNRKVKKSVSYNDVMYALSKRFCSLPPFCQCPTSKPKENNNG